MYAYTYVQYVYLAIFQLGVVCHPNLFVLSYVCPDLSSDPEIVQYALLSIGTLP